MGKFDRITVNNNTTQDNSLKIYAVAQASEMYLYNIQHLMQALPYPHTPEVDDILMAAVGQIDLKPLYYRGGGISHLAYLVLFVWVIVMGQTVSIDTPHTLVNISENMSRYKSDIRLCYQLSGVVMRYFLMTQKRNSHWA